MKKFLFIFSFGLLLLGLGGTVQAGDDDNWACNARGGGCCSAEQVAAQTAPNCTPDKDCTTDTSGCNAGVPVSPAGICCTPKTGVTPCAFPNECLLACGPENAISGICTDPTKPTCCKPKCTMCRSDCTGSLEIDTSKSTFECPSGEDKCCKAKAVGGGDTGGGNTGGGTTQESSFDLATLSPVPDVDVPTLIGYIIKGALGIVGSIALLMFVYGGFLMLISQGDPGKVKKGKDALIWATAGLVVIFGSYIFVNFILNALSNSGT